MSPLALWSPTGDAAARAALEGSARMFEQVAIDAIEEHRSANGVKRRAHARMRSDMLHDRWSTHLLASMRNYFSTTEALSAVVGKDGKRVDTSENIFRAIVEELAVLYLRQPKRWFEPESAGAAYELLLEETGFGQFWVEAERALCAHNDMLVWPSSIYDGTRKTIRHRIATPDCFSVLVDDRDPATPLAYVIEYSSETAKAPLYEFWSREWYGLFTSRGGKKLEQVVPSASGDDALLGYENPYGQLIQVAIHSGTRSADFFDADSGRDIVERTLAVGELRTLTRHSWKMSSFKQLAAFGENVTTPQEQIRDEGAVLRFEAEGGSLQVIDWQFDADVRARWIQSELAAAAASRGINPEALKRTANYQTAAGAKLADRGLLERRRVREEAFAQAERDYYRSVCRVAETHAISTALPIDARLMVEFAPVEYPNDPLSEINLDERRVALGVVSRVELAMRANPEMSEEQARAFVLSNIEFEARLAAIKQHAASNNGPAVNGTPKRNAETGEEINLDD